MINLLVLSLRTSQNLLWYSLTLLDDLSIIFYKLYKYFSFQPVLHDLCNKGRGMCYHVWNDAYKRTIAANQKEQPMWRQRVSSLASEWSFTICLTPYNP